MRVRLHEVDGDDILEFQLELLCSRQGEIRFVALEADCDEARLDGFRRQRLVEVVQLRSAQMSSRKLLRPVDTYRMCE